MGLALAAPVIEPAPLDPLAACIAHAGQVRGLGEVQPDQTKIALVVGVPCHDDPSIPSLQFGTHDAMDLGARLQGRGYTVHALTTRVSRGDFLDALDTLGRALAPGGELVVYFSGHGVLRETDVGLERFLVFSDTDLGRVEDSGLSAQRLEASLQRIPARRRVVVQDTCYAAGEGSKGLGLPEGAKAVGLPGPALAPPDTRLYASRFYELATEDLDLGGSVYTRSLVEALDAGPDLDGDGCVGLLEAHLAATDATVERRDGYQHPEWSGTFANDACSGPALRGVVLERGRVRSVEPGRIGDRRVAAGSWVVVAPVRRWRVEVGLRGAGRLWDLSRGSLGGEAHLTYRGPVVGVFGFRGAWGLPTDDARTRLGWTEGLARIGVMTPSRVAVGLVSEGGVTVLVPNGLPTQTATLLGQYLRGQVELGHLYVALEGGVGVFLDNQRDGLRPVWIPTMAGSLGFRL